MNPDEKPVIAPRRLTRRHVVVGAGIVAAEVAIARVARDPDRVSREAAVFIGKAESYDADLASTIRDGLATLGLGPDWALRKSILLKPNLVEPTRQSPHINTHPSVVRAAIEVFRSWGAREVFVAEGQGHCRDTDYVLEQSGLGPVLDEAGVEFVDLNHDDVYTVINRGRASRLARLHLPRSLRRADRVVSLAKLKTHHWEGATLSMKNLFGLMPGVAYGWPKNVLHHAGITGSILDIHQAVAPDLAIIDGIVGMEGDGPIMGSPRHAGVIVMGLDFPAVDATAARLMGLDPDDIPHLLAASRSIGPTAERRIRQRGEPIGPPARRFAPPPRLEASMRHPRT